MSADLDQTNYDFDSNRQLKISHASAVMRSLKLPASRSDRTEEHTASCKYSK